MPSLYSVLVGASLVGLAVAGGSKVPRSIGNNTSTLVTATVANSARDNLPAISSSLQIDPRLPRSYTTITQVTTKRIITELATTVDPVTVTETRRIVIELSATPAPSTVTETPTTALSALPTTLVITHKPQPSSSAPALAPSDGHHKGNNTIGLFEFWHGTACGISLPFPKPFRVQNLPVDVDQCQTLLRRGGLTIEQMSAGCKLYVYTSPVCEGAAFHLDFKKHLCYNVASMRGFKVVCDKSIKFD